MEINLEVLQKMIEEENMQYEKEIKRLENIIKKIQTSCTLIPAIDSELLANKILNIIEGE